MDAFSKLLPLIIVALLIFAAKEGYSIFRYARLCKLHEAAKTGAIAKARQYLQSGHPVNAIDPRFGLTPLHYAVRNGHVDVARLLIEHGAGLDDPSTHGITPRQWTVEYLSPEDRAELQSLSDDLRKKQMTATDSSASR